MSKSLKRVQDALDTARIAVEMREMETDTRTAQQAAAAAGCDVDQIAKSIILQGSDSGRMILFLTAGGNQIGLTRAELLAGEPVQRPDANEVRRVTGFAVGGVSPIGHLTDLRAFMDPRLAEFDTVWAAAGTPRHIFSISSGDLQRITNARITDFTCK